MENLSNFIFSGQNTIFLYSIILMVGIFILELFSMIIGFQLSGLIDDALPDIDIDGDVDLDVDTDIDVDGFPFHHAILHWFNIGKVPFLVLVVIFLTIFGLTGYILQFAAVSLLSFYPSRFFIVPIVLLITFYLLHITGRFVAKIIPSEESSAVSQESFIGKVAVITTGTAKRKKPAQIKLKDEFGRYHYVMAEPLNDEDLFQKGDEVLIVDKKGRIYLIDAFDIN